MLLRVFLCAVGYLAASGLAQTNSTSAIDAEIALLPPCGLACIHEAVAAVGCGFTDYACMCGPLKAAIRMHAVPCITSQCSASDGLKIQPITVQVCLLEASLQNSSASTNTAAQASSTLSTTTSNLATTTTRSSAVSASPTANGNATGAPSSTTTALPSSADVASSSSTAISQHASNTGLSKGAIVGVAVGASVGGLLLIAAIGLFAFGYRKRGRDLKHLEALSRVDRKIEGRHELDGASPLPKVEEKVQNDVG